MEETRYVTVMDNSSANTTGEIPAENYYLAATFCVIALVGIPGNSLVMISVLLSSSLQTPTNAFLTSLGVADLLQCAILPLQAVVILQDAEDSVVPGWVCTGMAFCTCVCNVCSVLHLLVIAVARCIFLSDNNAIKYAHLRTKRNVVILIIVAWVIPCVVYTVPEILGVSRLGYHGKLKLCIFREEKNTVTNVYMAIVVLIYSVTLLTIVVCHLKIVCTINKQRVRLASFMESQGSGSRTGDTNKNARGETENEVDCEEEWSECGPEGEPLRASNADNGKRLSQDPRRQSVVSHIDVVISRQFEITKYLTYVTVAFIVCVMPTCFCLTTPKCYNNYLTYMFILLVFNSCVNPFIYSFKDQNFRVVFGAILQCHISDVPNLTCWSQKRKR